MTQKKHSRTGLFMTELILVLFFFSIAAAVCLQVYGKAALISGKSEKLKLALNSTENLAQLLKDADGDIAVLEEYDPWLETGEILTIYHNQEGFPCSREEAYYWVEVSLENGEGLHSADLVSRDTSGEEIYSLTVKWVSLPEASEELRARRGIMA